LPLLSLWLSPADMLITCVSKGRRQENYRAKQESLIAICCSCTSVGMLIQNRCGWSCFCCCGQCVDTTGYEGIVCRWSTTTQCWCGTDRYGTYQYFFILRSDTVAIFCFFCFSLFVLVAHFPILLSGCVFSPSIIFSNFIIASSADL
jgi:hypothetical protein